MKRKDIPIEIQNLIEERTLEHCKNDSVMVKQLLSGDEWNIGGFFVFKNTPEGLDFWGKISTGDFSVYYDRHHIPKLNGIIDKFPIGTMFDKREFPKEWWIESFSKDEQNILRDFFNSKFLNHLPSFYDQVGCTFGFIDSSYFYNISEAAKKQLTKITFKEFMDQFYKEVKALTKGDKPLMDPNTSSFEVPIPEYLIGIDPIQSNFLIEEMKDIPIRKKNIKHKFKIETFN